MKNFFKNKNGFALLYALLLTGAVLSIGVILMNIITKQLVYSSVSRSSETAYYYLANSGRECLINAMKNPNDNIFFSLGDTDPNPPYDTEVTFKADPTINCLGVPVTLISDRDSTYPTYTSAPTSAGSGQFNLSAQFNGCKLTNESATCNNPGMIGNYTYVLRANGYGAGGDRSAFRSAFRVLK